MKSDGGPWPARAASEQCAESIAALSQGDDVRTSTLIRTLAVAMTATALAVGQFGVASATATTTTPDHTLPANSRFYVAPDSEALRQAATYLGQGDVRDAATMAKLAS